MSEKEKLQVSSEKIYIMMNKPAGVVCSSVSDSHKTVYELLPLEFQRLMLAKRGNRLHTVGRLDCDTSGLLLITNDGIFSHEMTSPDFRKIKQYYVTLINPVNENQQKKIIELFSKPIVLPPEKKSPQQIADPAEIQFLSETVCKVEIYQGMFHQIKRMFLAAGNQVEKLHRVKVGDFQLDESLQEGQWKLLSLS